MSQNKIRTADLAGTFADKQVIFNDNGIPSSDASFTFDKATEVVSMPLGSKVTNGTQSITFDNLEFDLSGIGAGTQYFPAITPNRSPLGAKVLLIDGALAIVRVDNEPDKTLAWAQINTTAHTLVTVDMQLDTSGLYMYLTKSFKLFDDTDYYDFTAKDIYAREKLKILESGTTPTKYTIFQGGDQAADITYTLPTAQGAAGTVMKNDGSGVLSWDDSFLHLDGSDVTIGSGASGIDYSLTFHGHSGDGKITWVEDDNNFLFDKDFFIRKFRPHYALEDTAQHACYADFYTNSRINIFRFGIEGSTGETFIEGTLPYEGFIYCSGVSPMGFWVDGARRIYIMSSGVTAITSGLILAYVAKTATYPITANDHTIDCTANSFTVTLPTAVGCAGQEYVIKNSGTGAITVATTSSQTIDGVTSASLGTQYDSLIVKSNGANWIRIN